MVVSVEIKRINVDTAKEILGWGPGNGEDFTFTYDFENTGKPQKILLSKNAANRPFNLNRALRIAKTMLDGRWAGQWNSASKTINGESMIVDKDDQIVSCAHRLVGLIIAQHMRNQLEDSDLPPKIKIESVFVQGVDPQGADTVDQADERKLGEVLFRRGLFEKYRKTERVILNRQLAIAIRLVWVRFSGQKLAGARKFTFEEAIGFFKAHPGIEKCLVTMHELNQDHKKSISYLMTLGVAAGLMYIESCVWDPFKDKIPDNVLKFWTDFAKISAREMKSGENPQAGALVSVLDRNARAADEKYSRDGVCVLVARSWHSYVKTRAMPVDRLEKWADGKSLATALTIKTNRGTYELDFLRFGGPDRELEPGEERNLIPPESELENVEELEQSEPREKKKRGPKPKAVEPVEPAEPKKKERKIKSRKDLIVGDRCIVKQPQVGEWPGEITEIEEEDGKPAFYYVKSLEPDDDEAVYTCMAEWVCVS